MGRTCKDEKQENVYKLKKVIQKPLFMLSQSPTKSPTHIQYFSNHSSTEWGWERDFNFLFEILPQNGWEIPATKQKSNLN